MKPAAAAILSVFITIGTVLSLVPDIFGVRKTYSPERDDIILNCAVVSDTHADANTFRDRSNNLRKAFAGVGESTKRIDVLLNIGDVTNCGVEKEYRLIKRVTTVYAKPKKVIACMGNHDSWYESTRLDYENAKRLFLDYLAYYGIHSETVYYSQVIEGYHFICPGTEACDHESDATYSPEQLRWFDGELTKAEESGKPIFVLNHKPIAGHNTGDPGTTDAIGEVLLKHAGYENKIIYFSGHDHNFGPECFESEGNIYYISLPSFVYNDETVHTVNDKGGMGYAMEVYSDEVVLKARNYIKDKWIDGYEMRIKVGQ